VKQVKAPIVSALEAAPETCLLWVEAPEIAGAARPGQFIMVACGGGTFLPRPFSIHRVDNSQIALLFKVVGKGTGWLAAQKKGSSLDVFGPLGNGFTVKPEAKNLLLVAGGLGIAPLVYLAETAVSRGYAVHIHQGVNNAGEISLNKLLPHYQVVQPAQATLYGSPINSTSSTSTIDGSAGVTGMATIIVPGLAAWADQIFACGPAAMYRTMAQMPELAGKDVQLSLEIMMGCGTGVCYGCTIRTKKGLKQVCKDGPVFVMDELALT
jgi:dihydroorotate dehydrogenase electron transfer subunit